MNIKENYISASKTGVSMNEMINYFKTDSSVSNIAKEGTVNNIYQNSGRLVKCQRWFN